jgi:hypothetical protein
VPYLISWTYTGIPARDYDLVHFGHRAERPRPNVEDAVISKMGIAREKDRDLADRGIALWITCRPTIRRCH